MRFSDISIAARLCICALVPLLAVVALATHLVHDEYASYARSKRVAWQPWISRLSAGRSIGCRPNAARQPAFWDPRARPMARPWRMRA